MIIPAGRYATCFAFRNNCDSRKKGQALDFANRGLECWTDTSTERQKSKAALPALSSLERRSLSRLT